MALPRAPAPAGDDDVAAPGAAVRVQGLRFAYRGGNDALALDDFVVPAGGEVLVTGPSGCGKTTLLHLIAGLLRPRQGTIAVDGQDMGALAGAARDRFRGRRIGIVLQQFHLLPALTAMENLLVAQTMAGTPADRAAARTALDALGVADRAGAWPHQMSAGEQQRVAIARALVNRPRLVLADEPTSSLDDDACAAVTGLLLGAARQYGAALVIATHDGRLKSRILRHLALPATGAGGRG